jgi:hypothetical protein
MGRPPKITQVTHNVAEEATTGSTASFNIPGLVFRWVNIRHRNSKGWGIWSPVLRDSEYGKIIAEQMGYADRFAGMNANSNLFHEGSDGVLAFSTVEKHAEYCDKISKGAEERMNMIDAAQVRRNVIIPASSGFSRNFGG